jgi:threonine dehydrogenase-like Zn-dependent dehydrogenase
MHTRACWTIGPGVVEIRDEVVPEPRPGQVAVRALVSGISRGSEGLVFRGQVPPTLAADMRAPHQAGDFPFPVKYGYASVGVVEASGQRVFCLHPHQDRYVVDAEAVLPLPDEVPSERAVLAANVETALNALWDAPVLPASRVAVVGAGTVGLAVALLASALPGVRPLVIDVAPERRALAASLGLEVSGPGATDAGHDLVFHASARAAGLAEALRIAGTETTVVELSWYGIQEPPVPLGGRFHAQRLRIVSSQVGQVAASMRPRWSRRRRLAAALALLADARWDRLLGEAIPFLELPLQAEGVLAASAGSMPLVRY